jgi:hypothetical protein
VKIAVFLDHDIVIRNFALGGAFAGIETAHDVTYVLPDPSFKRRVTIGPGTAKLRGKVKHLPILPKRHTVWSRLFHVHRMRWRKGPQAKYLRFSSRVAVGRFHAIQFTLLALPGVFQLYRAFGDLRLAANPNVELERFLKDEKPDLIIHPTVMDGLFVNDVVEYGQRHSIPVFLLMNSWDNISTLRYLHKLPTRLFVWGQQTMEHARQYFGIAEPQVVRFGAAQFDIYRVPAATSRETYLRANGLPLDKAILMYAGSSKILDEYSHLLVLEAWIAENPDKGVHVFYRPHPWGIGGKNGPRILDHPWRHVTIDPSMVEYLERVRAGWDGVYLTDYGVMRDALTHVDAVVSPLSTVIVEAAVMGKASMCYLPTEEDSISFKRVSPLQHFVPIYESQDFITARTQAEFLPNVEALIERSRSPGIAQHMRKAASFFADSFAESYSTRLLAYVDAFFVRAGGSKGGPKTGGGS